MKNATRLFILFTLIQISKCAMEGFVVGGEYANIANYPHSAFLDARCKKIKEHWICGSAILNQKILLTAAHCVYGCNWSDGSSNQLMALVGHSNLKQVSIKRLITDVIIHAYYAEKSMNNDIALAEVRREIPLGKFVKRVIISRNFPHHSFDGYVAGWGIISDEKPVSAIHLKSVQQRLQSTKTCSLIGHLHQGMFCAGSTNNEASRPAQGDSGSALMTAKGFQQIGLVSFCIKRFPALMVYTNVSFYYNWIANNANKLYCANKGRRKQ